MPMHMAERKDEARKMASCRSHEYPAQALSLNSVSHVPSVRTNKRKKEKREEREKTETEKKKERERKSAAPGLPAWSPTAVLPRLEPA